MIGYPHPIARMKLRGVDMDMELGKVLMLPLIASRAYQNTVVGVAMLEIFGLQFLQLKSLMQKSYVALWFSCTFLETLSMIHILDECRIE